MRAILLAAILTSMLAAATAAPSLEQEWTWCRDDDSPRLIGACTAIIGTRGQPPEQVARAYFNRGRAYSDKGDDDRAIRDFDAAIRLDPRYPDAFNNRGVAYSNKGDYARAARDFDTAIGLDPNYAIALYNRGLAARNLGHPDEAEQFFTRAKQAGPRLIPPKE